MYSPQRREQWLAPDEVSEGLFHCLQDIRRDFAVPKHEPGIRDRADLIDQKVRIEFQTVCFLNSDSKRKMIARRRGVRLAGSRDDDGGRVPRSVQGIGLKDQSGSLLFPWLLFVSLRFEIHRPHFTAQSLTHVSPSETLASIASATAAL